MSNIPDTKEPNNKNGIRENIIINTMVVNIRYQYGRRKTENVRQLIIFIVHEPAGSAAGTLEYFMHGAHEKENVFLTNGARVTHYGSRLKLKWCMVHEVPLLSGESSLPSLRLVGCVC